MDFKQIQELIKIINKSNIGELSIEEKDFKITIRQKEEPSTVYQTSAPSPAYLPAPVAQASAPVNTQLNTHEPATQPKPADNLVTIKSPMIGTFTEVLRPINHLL
jgi:acetyl-CoA carboxylase biotin carboxyl carrier protein